VIDFGETYSSPNYEVRDTANALADASTVTVSLTLPDGTTAAPTATHASLGVYNFDYLTAQAGIHTGSVTATGGTLGSLVRKWPVEFTVRPAVPALIVSLEDVRSQLNITSHADDEEILGYIEAATRVVEGYIGPVMRRTITADPYDGGGTQILLRKYPVLSVTTVTQSGTALAVTGYNINTNTGILTRVNGSTPVPFLAGYQNIVVTYIVGRAADLGNITLAAKMIVQHLWTSQRAESAGRPASTFGDLVEVAPFGAPFAVPRRAIELLEPDRWSGIA
jgi:hypothetical protein